MMHVSEMRERNQEMKIVGIGACVMDTLITVPHYPKEDTKLKALEVRAAGGGPTATGLVAAARLGVESGYIGVLSDDNGGAFLPLALAPSIALIKAGFSKIRC